MVRIGKGAVGSREKMRERCLGKIHGEDRREMLCCGGKDVMGRCEIFGCGILLKKK